MLKKEDIDFQVESHKNNIINSLKKLVNISSNSYDIEGQENCIEIIEEELADSNLLIRKIKTKGHAPILIIENRKTNFIVLTGHLDTVQPNFNNKPFYIKNNRGYGPGALDMKGGIVTILYALKMLAEFNLLDKIPIKVILNCDEEIGSIHSKNIMTEEAKDASAIIGLEYGRNNNIVITRTGLSLYQLTIGGKSAHAGNEHHKGINAIDIMAVAISKISSFTNYKKRILANVGKVTGGTAHNVVPEKASIKFEVRTSCQTKNSKIKNQLDKLINKLKKETQKVELINIYEEPPLKATTESKLLANSYKTIAEQFDLNLKISKLPSKGTSNVNFFAKLNIPIIDAVGPSGNGAHQENEFINLDDLLQKTKTLTYWLINNYLK